MLGEYAYDIIMVLMHFRVRYVHIGSQRGRRQENVYVQVLEAPHCLIFVENLQAIGR
jgi:hypothetical protein